MPKRYFAFQNFDATKHVRAAIREKTISHKHAREIAVAMKGLSIEKARDYLILLKFQLQLFVGICLTLFQGQIYVPLDSYIF